MEMLIRCTIFCIRLYCQPSNSDQVSEQMEKLEVLGTLLCYINQNKANVKRLRGKFTFCILGASNSFKD